MFPQRFANPDPGVDSNSLGCEQWKMETEHNQHLGPILKFLVLPQSKKEPRIAQIFVFLLDHFSCHSAWGLLDGFLLLGPLCNACSAELPRRNGMNWFDTQLKPLKRGCLNPTAPCLNWSRKLVGHECQQWSQKEICSRLGNSSATKFSGAFATETSWSCLLPMGDLCFWQTGNLCTKFLQTSGSANKNGCESQKWCHSPMFHWPSVSGKELCPWLPFGSNTLPHLPWDT